ncbi:MAG: GDSL-type esterase/lipase family protein [Paludibacter sp.]
MKTHFLKTISIIMALAITCNVVATKITVYVIGDSTAASYATSLYPRAGWAQLLQLFFNADSVVVNNQAASGRSSKSFYNEGRWTTVTNTLKAGDYVLIQFAHNDEKTDDTTRYTNPATTFKDYLTIYVNGARAKGAIPVFLSSIPRNNWSGSAVQQAHKPYTDAMKSLSASLSVPFIDMEAGTMAYLNSVGKTYSTDSVFNNLKAGVWPNYTAGNSDGTHLQENGAYQFARTLVADLNANTQYAPIVRLAKNTKQAYRISAMPKPDLKGTITGTGIFQSGSQTVLKATAATGFRFVKWTMGTDTAAVSRNTSLTLNAIGGNASYTANFEAITAVADVNADGVRVFPNPAKNVLNIEIDKPTWQTSITDLAGRKLLVSANQKGMDISTLKAGMYLVEIELDNLKITNKVFVAR